MMRAILPFIVLLCTSFLVTAATASDHVVAPFFVRRDEGGELVVMVVYGPHDHERVAVYCRGGDSRRRHVEASGPGVMQCVETNPMEQEYELYLPFQFVRNDQDEIIGVSYDDPEGMTILFRLRENSLGETVAEPIVDETLRIPYVIQYGEDGSVEAVVFDHEDDETKYVVPMEFIQADDGSRVIGAKFNNASSSNEASSSEDESTGLVVDMGLISIVLGLLILVSVGFYVKQRQDRVMRSNDALVYDVAKSDVSEQGTTDESDDRETIPVL